MISIQMIKDFLEWRRNFRPVEGKPLSLNLRANSPAATARHVGRIIRILSVLQDPNITKQIRSELEYEFNQRKAALAVIGTVLPDNFDDINRLYNTLTNTITENANG